MFGIRKKQAEVLHWDPAAEKPVVRVSICTGEKTGCLQNLHTKHLKDVMLIRGDADLAEFCRLTGTAREDLEEVW